MVARLIIDMSCHHGNIWQVQWNCHPCITCMTREQICHAVNNLEVRAGAVGKFAGVAHAVSKVWPKFLSQVPAHYTCHAKQKPHGSRPDVSVSSCIGEERGCISPRGPVVWFFWLSSAHACPNSNYHYVIYSTYGLLLDGWLHKLTVLKSDN